MHLSHATSRQLKAAFWFAVRVTVITSMVVSGILPIGISIAHAEPQAKIVSSKTLLLQTNPVIIVNSTADAVDATPGNGVCATNGGVCTLRAAIQEANVRLGADTITLPAGQYILTLGGNGEDFGAAGDLDIKETLTINGQNASNTIISANQLVERQT
jgi:CSLREA domain-containing protein